METPEFEYHRPATLAEACELGCTLGEQARYLAGGTDLIVDLRQERFSVQHLIALAGVPELSGIAVHKDILTIGALTTLEDVARSEEVRRFLPALAAAISWIGSVQVRNQGTIGGNFCGGVPCADAPPICLAAEAELRIVGPGGERMLPAVEFFHGPRQIALGPGEVLAEVRIPKQPRHSGASYQRFSLRHGSSLAVASVAARIVLEKKRIADARLVLGAVAPVPLPVPECSAVLVGKSPSRDLFEEAALIAAREAKPITDIRGSQAYRRSLVEVLTFRALEEATRRAGGK